MFTAGEVFSIAVQIEANGEKFYREALANTADPSLQELLQWLADEEARHRKFFQGIKNSIAQADTHDDEAQMGEAVLQSIVKDRTFSLDEVQVSAIRHVAELVAIGVELEEDSIAFYEILLGFVDDSETARHINEIIEEERRHIELLRERVASRP